MRVLVVKIHKAAARDASSQLHRFNVATSQEFKQPTQHCSIVNLHIWDELSHVPWLHGISCILELSGHCLNIEQSTLCAIIQKAELLQLFGQPTTPPVPLVSNKHGTCVNNKHDS